MIARSTIGADRERGGGIAEFAVASSFVLTLVFGILDFGRALFTYDTVAYAARVATRYAIVNGSDCGNGCALTSAQIQTYVQNQMPGINAPALVITTAWSGTDLNGNSCSSAANQQGPGCTVTSTASYSFKFIAFPYTSAMTSTSQMYVAN